MTQKTKDILLKVSVNVCRMLLALTFVFSGLVKANDPYGMSYKLTDYLTAWGVSVPELFTLVGAVVLAYVEFIIGLYLFFGISRRPVARITWVLMLLMTLLTVYIAIFNPVSDCGCFGDAVILTNVETLLKNIVLLAASFVVLRYYELQIKFVSMNTGWIISLLSNVYVLVFAGVCIATLPMIDFRPYHLGADIRKGVELPDSLRPQYDVKVVYTRNGETLELGIDDDDPDSTWTYVETKRVLVKEAGKTLMSDFYIIDNEYDEDITEMVLANEGYTFLLVAPLLETANQGYIGRINNIYDYTLQHEYGFYCVSASDSVARAYWTDHTGAEYPIYRGDERTLKTVVRSNPGLVLLKDGKIINKFSVYQMPGEEMLAQRLEDSEFGQLNYVSLKSKLTLMLALFVLPLLLLTLIDRLAAGWSFYRRLKRKSKDLQLENIERKLGIEKPQDVPTANEA